MFDLEIVESNFFNVVIKHKDNIETFSYRTERKDVYISDVLDKLISDYNAGKKSFDKFCESNFYSNENHLSARLYLHCQNNGTKLVRLLGWEMAEKISLTDKKFRGKIFLSFENEKRIE
jgi:hypothetical protein